MKLPAVTVVAVVLAFLVDSVVLQRQSETWLASKQVSEASNKFANQLFQEIGRTEGNALVCPISLHVALALVYLGAGGATAQELSHVTRLNKQSTDIKQGYKALLTAINDKALNIATKLFPAIGYPLNDSFVRSAQEFFHSGVQGLDYNDNKASANTINSYVEQETNGKIRDLISPGSLSHMTRLVIINAVHFQGTWKKMFENAYEGHFKVSAAEKVKTRLMTRTDTFGFKEDAELQAKVLKMDYIEGDYSMIFVLPNKEGGLPEVEAKLARTDLPTLLQGLREAKVEVTIPKFTLEMTIDLKGILAQMGISQLFSSRANLNGISPDNLFVSEVIQKTFINVHENGTEAAAATGFLETLSAVPDTNFFYATKPFHLYLINNQRQKEVVLFEGRFMRPNHYKPEDTLDSVAQKVEGAGQKETLPYPGDGPAKKPQSMFQGSANGNQKPESGRRPVNYQPNQYQSNVHYDRFDSQPPAGYSNVPYHGVRFYNRPMTSGPTDNLNLHSSVDRFGIQPVTSGPTSYSELYSHQRSRDRSYSG